jgi:hypothetical protein
VESFVEEAALRSRLVVHTDSQQEEEDMTSHGKRRIRRLLVGVLAAAFVVPASAAAANYSDVVQIGGDFVALSQVSAWQASADTAPSSRLVQIGGDLVDPSQVSAWQASADLAPSSRLVQIGGELVEPSQLSAWQSHAADRVDSSTALVAQDSGFDWSDAGYAAAAGIGALLLIGGCMGAFRSGGFQPPLAGAHP